MLKGTPIKKRDIRWTKKHEKKLVAGKKRRKARKGTRRGGNMITMSQAERQYHEAMEREKKTIAPSLLSRWSKRLFLWFISLKVVVWIRKLHHWWNERQYLG